MGRMKDLGIEVAEACDIDPAEWDEVMRAVTCVACGKHCLPFTLDGELSIECHVTRDCPTARSVLVNYTQHTNP